MSEYELIDTATTPDRTTFFKTIPQHWYNDFSGDVEAPTGWFGVVDVDRDLCDEVDDILKRETRTEITYGLYLVVINSDGLLWAYTVDAETERDRDRALMEEFGRRCNACEVWDEQDD